MVARRARVKLFCFERDHRNWNTDWMFDIKELLFFLDCVHGNVVLFFKRILIF